MDISEQYIKMSVKAWPDLERELQYDDIVYSLSRRLIGRVDFSLDATAKVYLSVTKWKSYILVDAEDWIVVFRQDQLQEIINCIPGNHIEIMKKFTDAEHFFSLEQKCLAFVMREKYNKAWNGEDWIA